MRRTRQHCTMHVQRIDVLENHDEVAQNPPSPRLKSVTHKASPHQARLVSSTFSIPHSLRPLCAENHRIAQSRRVEAQPRSMATHSGNDLPLSKRRRVTRACDNCKSRKRRCDGEKPCAYCTEHRAICTYDAPYTRGKPESHTIPSSREEAVSPGLSRWPQSGRNSLAQTATLPKDVPASPHDASRWQRDALNQAASTTVDDDDRAGTQSSRARSPIGGEGAAPMGQYLGPTSPFSVCYLLHIRQTDSPWHNLGLLVVQ